MSTEREKTTRVINLIKKSNYHRKKNENLKKSPL